MRLFKQSPNKLILSGLILKAQMSSESSSRSDFERENFIFSFICGSTWDLPKSKYIYSRARQILWRWTGRPQALRLWNAGGKVAQTTFDRGRSHILIRGGKHFPLCVNIRQLQTKCQTHHMFRSLSLWKLSSFFSPLEWRGEGRGGVGEGPLLQSIIVFGI